MKKEILPASTERLNFRRLALSDLDFVAEMLAHPMVMRYYPKCYSRDESRGWIERQLLRYDRDGHGLWLVSHRETGESLGQVGLLLQEVDGNREPEVGYLLHFPYWKKGYAVEAATATRELAFRQMNLPYVISLIRPENTPSQNVARRIGMSPIRETFFHGYLHLVFRINSTMQEDRRHFAGRR